MSKLFELISQSADGKQRAGVLHIGGKDIPTPVFMPVGTQGSVKSIDSSSLIKTGTKIILGNSYHIYLRAGIEVLKEFGGLKNLMKWNGSMLTDSGGYQVFSLKDLRKLSEEGVEFRSHIDGSKHFFSPEKVIEIQRFIGTDIMMPLDECTHYPSQLIEAKKSMELTLRWAERSKQALESSLPMYENEQFLFAIGQGSMFPELRRICMKNLVDMDFDGYAIGGLSVGEPLEMMYEMTDVCTDLMPELKPRYLMGVGTPANILESISLGIDMFDCVLPTRNARNGQLFTTKGKINIKNAKYKFEKNVIDENLQNGVSDYYSLSYLRHLFICGEILGLMMATFHNIAFYQWLMKTAREKILTNEFRQWKDIFLQNYSEID